MRADELKVGSSYAYIPYDPSEPLRAEVLENASSGRVKVQLHHPDLGSEEVVVATRDLANGWDEEPDERFLHPGQQLMGRFWRAKDAGESFTWADQFTERYARVQRQRALADRLGRFGMPRGHQNYAGKGGRSHENDPRVQLVPSYDELEVLLAAAEGGPAQPIDPTAVHTTVEAT